MSISEVRRAQMVSTFGPGAMQVIRNGISVITSGLDHWFSGYQESLNDAEEFRIDEPRLAKRLGVDFFMLPPDWRIPGREESYNAGLKIPVMRFPQWHACSTPSCHYLMKVGMDIRSRQIECPKCRLKDRFSPMHQVRFVTACEDGHLSDFPWNEWAHNSVTPSCDGTELYLRSSGSTSLSAFRVYCKACNTKPRSLEGTTQATTDGSSFITKNLQQGNIYTCKGHSPWLGNHQTGDCTKPVRAALRGASNVYFADIVSSLLLPVGENTDQELIDLILHTESLRDQFTLAQKYNLPLESIAPNMKKDSLALTDYSVTQIIKALEIVERLNRDGEEQTTPDHESFYRKEERQKLMNIVQREQLRVEPADITQYEEWFADAFSHVSLIHKLTETRALSGFFRLSSNNNQERDFRIQQLRKNAPAEGQLWLPASQVFGEGIYLELSHEKISNWLKQSNDFVQKRTETLIRSAARSFRHIPQPITPEYILLHTFSHLIINQLVFECGYSSASLRERIYYPDPKHDIYMAGILIYTAAGDSEGSMGGLVNMGRSGNFEPIIRKALGNAQWCSSDPVCMEAADRGGQGPESLNLAACHACALLPETSCEAFNCFLDRGVVTGNELFPEGGYFS